MNITFLKRANTANELNPERVNALFKAIRMVSGPLNADFDKRLHDDVQALFLAVIAAEDEVRAGLLSLTATVSVKQLEIPRKKIIDLEKSGLAPEILEPAIAQLWTSIGALVGRQQADIDHVGSQVRRRTLTLESLNLTARATELLPEVRMKINLDSAQLEADTATLAQVRKDRTALDEAINALETAKWEDILGGLPTLEDLKKMSLPVPELAAIEAGLKLLEELLGKLAEGIKYVELIGERDRLRARQEQLVNTTRGLEAALVEHRRREHCLDTALTLHAQKEELKRELMWIPSVLQETSLTIMAAQRVRDIDTLVDAVDQCAVFVTSTYNGIR